MAASSRGSGTAAGWIFAFEGGAQLVVQQGERRGTVLQRLLPDQIEPGEHAVIAWRIVVLCHAPSLHRGAPQVLDSGADSAYL